MLLKTNKGVLFESDGIQYVSPFSESCPVWTKVEYSNGKYITIREELKDIVDLIENNQKGICEKVKEDEILLVDFAAFGNSDSVIARKKGKIIKKIHRVSVISIIKFADLVEECIRLHNPYYVKVNISGCGMGIFDILLDRGWGNILRPVIGKDALGIEKGKENE